MGIKSDPAVGSCSTSSNVDGRTTPPLLHPEDEVHQGDQPFPLTLFYLTQWITDIQKDVLGWAPPTDFDMMSDKELIKYEESLKNPPDMNPYEAPASSFSRQSSEDHSRVSFSRQSSDCGSRSNSLAPTAINDLPLHLLERIFCELDLPSLFRIRRVARSWNDIGKCVIRRQIQVLALGGHRSIVWDTTPVGNRCPDPSHLLSPYGTGNFTPVCDTEYVPEIQAPTTKHCLIGDRRCGIISPGNVQKIFHIPADPVTRCFQINSDNGYICLYSVLNACSDLRSLHISYMELEARLLVSIANNCPNLEHVELSNCHGTERALKEGFLALAKHCPRLIHCRIMCTEIPLECILKSGLQLTSFTLYCCNMNGNHLVTAIDEMPLDACEGRRRLTHLSLDGCPKIRQEHLVRLLNSPNSTISHLSLQSMEISHEFWEQLTGEARNRLEKLDINVSTGFEPVPNRMDQLVRLQSLKINSFVFRQDSDAVLGSIFVESSKRGSLSQLSSILLHNVATPFLISTMSSVAPNLTSLDLSHVNRPNGSGPPTQLFTGHETVNGICELTHLQKLDVSGTLVTGDQTLTIVRRCSQLTHLGLNKCPAVGHEVWDPLVEHFRHIYYSQSNSHQSWLRRKCILSMKETALSPRLAFHVILSKVPPNLILYR